MTWFRRGREALTHAAPPPAQDDPATLRASLFTLNRHINQNSGKLPGEAVVLSRRITDTVREVIDTGDLRPLDIHTLVSVQAMIDDYLPTTLGQFLALNAEQLTRVRPTGETPVQSLVEQLQFMLDAAFGLLFASQEQDADALLTQGNFLRTKFSRSDLDL